MNLLHRLQQTFHAALAGLVPDPAPYVAQVKPAQDARFGDYQANCAMPLAKTLGRKPRDVAQELLQRLDLGDWLESPEIAGPGFINLRVRKDWLGQQLQQQAQDERLGVECATPVQTIVIDYSSPNVAKPMHVGHVRSTIIGDALARLFRFLGHRVITDNHLGDWGTQFGMLLYGYKHFRDEAALKADPVREMVRLYVHVRKLIDPIEKFEEAEKARKKRVKKDKKGTAEQAEPEVRFSSEELAKAREVRQAVRQETVKLHAGDAENDQLWQQFMPWCLAEIEQAYQRLDVKFDHMHGESFYNPMLPEVVADLLARGIAEESQGAVVIPALANDGEEEGTETDEPPAIIRKSDGAFTYTTSDLATIRYRLKEWKPAAILYVVGLPQSFHFKSLFEAARRAGYDRVDGKQVDLRHVAFGSVLGQDRKMFKTREGGTIELESLLDEAVQRAEQNYELTRQERIARGEEVPNISNEERRIAEAVGVGAVKYADLLQNRESDYVFDWDKMLAMDGNTATYMQYAYVRIRGIFRKSEEDPQAYRRQPPLPLLEQPEERALALQLLRFEETLQNAAAEYKPNLITAYLWDLAKSFNDFYQKHQVLKADTPELRRSRLLLCDLTARAIRQGLQLLGIQTVERM
jgi:arginyl-tRNA synthetase